MIPTDVLKKFSEESLTAKALIEQAEAMETKAFDLLKPHLTTREDFEKVCFLPLSLPMRVTLDRYYWFKSRCGFPPEQSLDPTAACG